LEKQISSERDRVQKLTKNLELETARFLEEKTELQRQLASERAKLIEVETGLAEEMKRFDKEKATLEEQLSESERLRKLKARQMNERIHRDSY
jgi:predicted  nucleic acid-binding Zn-ribbon protein